MAYDVVQPMPDELAVAHAGRMAMFMGVDSPAEFDRWLADALMAKAPHRRKAPRLEQLALVVGMDPQWYAQQHSMLGVLRVAARSATLHPFGSPEAASYSKRLGMLTQKTYACICPQCAEEDLQHWHFSWFRRSHHLAGVDACVVHKKPLLRGTSGTPWMQLPHQWLAAGEVQPERLGARAPTDFETRLGEVACAMLQRKGPLPSVEFVSALSMRAKHLGIRASLKGVRPNLSDWVKQVAPEEWISVHWPELMTKSTGEFFFSLDRVLSSRTVPSSGFAYLTAVTALWDKADEVNQALSMLEAMPRGGNTPTRHGRRDRGQAFWQGEVWETYMRCQGRVTAMAEELEMDPTYLRVKLRQLGLPPLADVDRSPIWNAVLRFQAGEVLQEACDAEGVSVIEVEPLIRICCSRVAQAARGSLKSPRQGLDNLQQGDQSSTGEEPGNPSIEDAHLSKPEVSERR